MSIPRISFEMLPTRMFTKHERKHNKRSTRLSESQCNTIQTLNNEHNRPQTKLSMNRGSLHLISKTAVLSQRTDVFSPKLDAKQFERTKKLCSTNESRKYLAKFCQYRLDNDQTNLSFPSARNSVTLKRESFWPKRNSQLTVCNVFNIDIKSTEKKVHKCKYKILDVMLLAL